MTIARIPGRILDGLLEHPGTPIHDDRLLRLLRLLVAAGWPVLAAEVGGYPKPPTVAGRRPDAIVRRGRTRYWLEVKAEGQVRRSRAQIDDTERIARAHGAQYLVVLY